MLLKCFIIRFNFGVSLMASQKRKRETAEQRFYSDLIFESSSSFQSPPSFSVDEEENYPSSSELNFNNEDNNGFDNSSTAAISQVVSKIVIVKL